MKLLADSCIGAPIWSSIDGLTKWHHDKPTLKHVSDFYDSDPGDDVWIKRIAEEGWLVISSDRGKKYGGPKLPRVCQEFGVTHILLGAALHRSKQFEKARAIIQVFPELIEAFNGPKGARYLLRMCPPSSFRLERR